MTRLEGACHCGAVTAVFDYEGESPQQRIARRRQRWTPLTLQVAAA
jgi:hypothetical protein